MAKDKVERPKAAVPLKSLRILIADDSALISKFIQCQLEMMGHQVVGRAADGLQAMDMVESLKPDIVLMDIEMPVMNGMEATRQIQEKFPCPIIMLTVHDDSRLIAKAGQVGASAYLVKPPDSTDIERTLVIAMARFSDMMELRRLRSELRNAQNEIKVLKGQISICPSCGTMRNEK